MESKKTNRKLNSYFWYILYTLPLLTLLVLFVGYLTFYKSTGSELKSQEEVVSYDYKGTDYVATEYVEKLYFNTNLSVEEVDNYLSKLDYVDDAYILFEDDVQQIGILDLSETGINGFFITHTYFEPFNLSLLYSSNLDISLQIQENFECWNPNFNGVLELNSLSNAISSDEVTSVNPSNISSYLVSTTPIELVENITYKESYFTIGYEEIADVTVYHEDKKIDNNSLRFVINTSITSDEAVKMLQSFVSVYPIDIDKLDGKTYYDYEFSSTLLLRLGLSDIDNISYTLLYLPDGDINGEQVPLLYYDDFIGLKVRLVNNYNNVVENDFISRGFYSLYDVSYLGDFLYEYFAYEEVVPELRSYQLSLFDYSLVQTNKTFDGFVVPVLSDGLNTIFGYLKLDITTFIARFVILLFTWMIQLKFIHIVIDMLSLVPDLYHEFANGRKC